MVIDGPIANHRSVGTPLYPTACNVRLDKQLAGSRLEHSAVQSARGQRMHKNTINVLDRRPAIYRFRSNRGYSHVDKVLMLRVPMNRMWSGRGGLMTMMTLGVGDRSGSGRGEGGRSVLN